MLCTNISMGRDSGVGVATRKRAGRVADRILVGTSFSGPIQTGPGTHPGSYKIQGLFLG